MKKSSKRLQLNRETVKTLSSKELDQAAGGYLVVNTTYCPRVTIYCVTQLCVTQACPVVTAACPFPSLACGTIVGGGGTIVQ